MRCVVAKNVKYLGFRDRRFHIIASDDRDMYQLKKLITLHLAWFEVALDMIKKTIQRRWNKRG